MYQTKDFLSLAILTSSELFGNDTYRSNIRRPKPLEPFKTRGEILLFSFFMFGFCLPSIYSQSISAVSNNGYAISGFSENNSAVVGQSVDGDGILGFCYNSFGVRGESLNGIGVVGGSSNYIGGRFWSGSGNPAIELVGNFYPGGSGADEAVIRTSPIQPSGDFFLISQDAVVVELDDNADESGTFEIWNDADNVVFSVNESGTVRVNGSIVHSSDRHQKENIISVDPAQILSSLVNIPLYTWRYKNDSAPHLGPMAQDFYQAYGLGADEKGIATVDADGVMMAAIQPLYNENQVIKEKLSKLENRMRKIEENVSKPFK